MALCCIQRWYASPENNGFFNILTRNIEFIDWKALGGEYLQANLYKVGIDTMNAINIISSKAA